MELDLIRELLTYSAEVNLAKSGCYLYLIDHSSSMDEVVETSPNRCCSKGPSSSTKCDLPTPLMANEGGVRCERCELNPLRSHRAVQAGRLGRDHSKPIFHAAGSSDTGKSGAKCWVAWMTSGTVAVRGTMPVRRKTRDMDVGLDIKLSPRGLPAQKALVADKSKYRKRASSVPNPGNSSSRVQTTSR